MAVGKIDLRCGEEGRPVTVYSEVILLSSDGLPKIIAENREVIAENGVPRDSIQWNAKAGMYTITVTDNYNSDARDSLLFTRKIVGKAEAKTTGHSAVEGIGFSLIFELGRIGCARFCVPSLRYTQKDIGEQGRFEYMEDRLPANMIYVWVEDIKRGFCFSKENPAGTTLKPARVKGQSCYCHRTENGSIGYRLDNSGISFISHWPYQEGDRSVALDANQTPACAFWPLDGEDFAVSLQYRLETKEADSFSAGLYGGYKGLGIRLKNKGENSVSLPFSLEESIGYRMESLAKTYREFDGKGAGFFFHFDPQKGYGSLPSGFGTAFNEIPHTSYRHILEYGFTGRQLNAALLCAQRYGEPWLDRGERVVDFFIDNCVTPNGWMYSLYDLEKATPFYSFGDPDAPKLHYVSRTNDKGNYLRTMVEPAFDLLRCYRYFTELNRERPEWLEVVHSFVLFLTTYQNEDGSWFRGYRPDGSAAVMEKNTNSQIAGVEEGQKTASAIPLAFLCAALRELARKGVDTDAGGKALVRGAEYTLRTMIKAEHYRGGTLDNPNIEDKEAAQYAMAAMWALYEYTKEEKWLDAARLAAYQFVTWNYIWNAPVLPGTILSEKKFRTKGFGAINSIWGGGVVDIYSLFHIRELYLTGKTCGDDFLCETAASIAHATQQILSFPGDLMGFTDTGMQPEGFGVCNQGIDEGMIGKGDIWGTLGWIYSAGIDGLQRYLMTL